MQFPLTVGAENGQVKRAAAVAADRDQRMVFGDVGVYVGNGKFIQSPRTGRDIQITSLSEDYWVRHQFPLTVGAENGQVKRAAAVAADRDQRMVFGVMTSRR
jgi:hypothetical protein